MLKTREMVLRQSLIMLRKILKNVRPSRASKLQSLNPRINPKIETNLGFSLGFNLNENTMEKTEKYIDNLKQKITVHYFNDMAQYEYEAKKVKHVVSKKSLQQKMDREQWRQV